MVCDDAVVVGVDLLVVQMREIGVVVGGIVAGYLLDRWLGTEPWLLIAGIVLGTAGAFVSLYRIMAKLG